MLSITKQVLYLIFHVIFHIFIIVIQNVAEVELVNKLLTYFFVITITGDIKKENISK